MGFGFEVFILGPQTAIFTRLRLLGLGVSLSYQLQNDVQASQNQSNDADGRHHQHL